MARLSSPDVPLSVTTTSSIMPPILSVRLSATSPPSTTTVFLFSPVRLISRTSSPAVPVISKAEFSTCTLAPSLKVVFSTDTVESSTTTSASPSWSASMMVTLELISATPALTVLLTTSTDELITAKPALSVLSSTTRTVLMTTMPALNVLSCIVTSSDPTMLKPALKTNWLTTIWPDEFPMKNVPSTVVSPPSTPPTRVRSMSRFSNKTFSS